MSNAAERSEIAVLQVQMKAVQADMSEMKGDMKEIKTLLLTNSETGISRKEFENYQVSQDVKLTDFKKSVKINYLLIGLSTAIVTAMAYALIVGRVK